MTDQFQELENILKGYGKFMVALSGGVDSTFLILYANSIPGIEVTAVTATGPNFAPDEYNYGSKICAERGIPHYTVALGDHFIDDFSQNPPDRCYICKNKIFTELRSFASGRGIEILADGTNADDLTDYRPGRRALKELGIKSPLALAGLTKAQIRKRLKKMGEEIWCKPAFACLASRVPYGQEITVEKLNAIYKGETYLKNLGLNQVRLRHHGDIARIEVPPVDRKLFFDESVMDKVDSYLKTLGFTYVTLDLGGYSMGKLNNAL